MITNISPGLIRGLQRCLIYTLIFIYHSCGYSVSWPISPSFLVFQSVNQLVSLFDWFSWSVIYPEHQLASQLVSRLAGQLVGWSVSQQELTVYSEVQKFINKYKWSVSRLVI